MRPLYIFDLDGTLALIDHRRHFVECERDQQNWRAFYEACVDDHPNKPVIRTMEQLRRGEADILIFSGRSETVREQTMQWLFENTLLTTAYLRHALTMRQQYDYTPDAILKKRWHENMLNEDKQRLVAVFDDRDKVVQMWRSIGVPCFQVANGAF